MNCTTQSVPKTAGKKKPGTRWAKHPFSGCRLQFPMDLGIPPLESISIGPADCNHILLNLVISNDKQNWLCKINVVTVAVVTVCWSYEVWRP